MKDNSYISKKQNDMYPTFLLLISMMLSLCFSSDNAQKDSMETALLTAPNILSSEARAAGWKMLFDGQTTKGWHCYGKDYVSDAWKVEDGTLAFDKSQGEEGGDIVTDEEFGDFDLRLEWKISPCGNSGIMFNVAESDEYQFPWQTGPEMQVLDNTCHPDAKIRTHRAGDLYDMIACDEEVVRPAGEWNQVRIRSKNGKTKFWLNGERVVKFRMFTDEWQEMIANSKFKDMKGFGQYRSGHLVLQDHGDKVWFRNIMVKLL